MAKKLPYLPLYTGDWLKDPALTLCAPATRGVWIDLLSAMHEAGRSGELCGTADQLARLARCSTADLALALTDLQTNKAADVTQRNGQITVINRRMFREHNSRISGALRQQRFRERHGQHDDVTPCMSSSMSLSSSAAQKTPKPPSADDANFERFWNAFPRGRRKSRGAARKAWEKARRLVDADTLIAAATEYAASAEGRGAFVKMPSTWLNNECWTDEREAWQQKDPAHGKSRIGPGQQYDPTDTSDRSL